MSSSKTHREFEHLSTSQVSNMRREWRSGKTKRQLAIKYGVSENTVVTIIGSRRPEAATFAALKPFGGML